MSDDNNIYGDKYSDTGFWEKLKEFAIKAGCELVEMALKLYYVLQKSGLPIWVKPTIIGALGYFISPIDAIPDITPVVGFSDDLGVLALALASVAAYVDDEVTEKAARKLKEWFADGCNKE